METEKRIFLVMEVVKGGPLSDLMESRFDKGEAFTDEQASIMIKSILSAVSHLHSKEIVHRDLKPGNFYEEKDPILFRKHTCKRSG